MIKRTTKDHLLVEVDKHYGFENQVMFTAKVIAPTSEPDIHPGDTVIVERDYLQHVSEKVAYAPKHSWYAILRGDEIVPFGNRLYLIADKDKNNTIKIKGMELSFPKNFKEYQTEVTTHDAIVHASPVSHIKPGDKVYCHHHLTHPSHERLINGVLYYELQLNQVYCTVSDDVQCYNGWNLVEPVQVENTDSIKLHKFDTDKSDKYGVIAYPDVDAKHLTKGMEIVFLPDRDYEMIVEGKRYYRIRTQDIVAQCLTK